MRAFPHCCQRTCSAPSTTELSQSRCRNKTAKTSFAIGRRRGGKGRRTSDEDQRRRIIKQVCVSIGPRAHGRDENYAGRVGPPTWRDPPSSGRFAVACCDNLFFTMNGSKQQKIYAIGYTIKTENNLRKLKLQHNSTTYQT